MEGGWLLPATIAWLGVCGIAAAVLGLAGLRGAGSQMTVIWALWRRYMVGVIDVFVVVAIATIAAPRVAPIALFGCACGWRAAEFRRWPARRKVRVARGLAAGAVAVGLGLVLGGPVVAPVVLLLYGGAGLWVLHCAPWRLLTVEREVDGQMTRVLERPGLRKRPTVLLHGLANTAENWRRVMYEVAIKHPTRHLIAPTIPGLQIGSAPLAAESSRRRRLRRSGAREVESLDWFARWVQAVIDVVSPGVPVTLAGHSAGARIGVEVALAVPERVVGIVTLSLPGLARSPEITRLVRLGWVMVPVAPAFPPQVVGSFVLWVTPGLDASARDTEMFRRFTTDESVVPSRLFKLVRELMTRKALGDLKVPIVTLWPDADKIVPADASMHALPQGNPDILAVRVGGDHGALRKAPRATAAAVAAALWQIEKQRESTRRGKTP